MRTAHPTLLIGVDRTFVDSSGAKFRPDVVNHATGEVVELKPITYSTGYLNSQANLQAQSYVDRLNELFGDMRTLEGAPNYWYRIEYYNK